MENEITLDILIRKHKNVINLAKFLKITRQSVYNHLSGKNIPMPTILQRYIENGISINEFYFKNAEYRRQKNAVKTLPKS